MTDRIELLEAALDSLPDGIVLFGSEGNVDFWNQAAEAITGYTRTELLERAIPDGLKPLLRKDTLRADTQLSIALQPGRGLLVRARHKLGHEVQLISRTAVLLDRLGEAVGMAALFHSVEGLDALPRGDASGSEELGASQTDLEERLSNEFEDFQDGGPSLGVLWIGVDQAAELCKTHGVGAWKAMIEKVHHTLAQGLRPGEELGRWGDDEFLIIAHERTAEMLSAHARTLTGLARTTDFRWWGDRVSITVSIGTAQICREQHATLAKLLESARTAMETSMQEGGNRITSAPKPFQEHLSPEPASAEPAQEGRIDAGNASGGNTCLPS